MPRWCVVMTVDMRPLLLQTGEVPGTAAEQAGAADQLGAGHRQEDGQGGDHDHGQWWECAHVQGGADNPQAPFVWLHVESADNFKDPETARILTQQLYQFLEEELGFKKVQFLFTKSKLIYVSVFLLWNIQLSGLGSYQFCQDDPNPCWYQRPNFERTFRKMKKIG